MKQRLGPDQRIKKKAEFDFLFKSGRSAKGKFFILWAADKNLPCAVRAARPSHLPKIAVSVSRQVDSRAVARNLWKRRIREAFRRNQEKVKDGTAVLVKVRRVQMPSYHEIEKELIFLLDKAGFLK